MSQDTYQLAVQHLEEKLTALLQRYKDQKATIIQLRKENTDLEQLLTHTKTDDAVAVRQLAQQLQAEGGSNASATLSNKIDTYIQEIDACIVHFEKL